MGSDEDCRADRLSALAQRQQTFRFSPLSRLGPPLRKLLQESCRKQLSKRLLESEAQNLIVCVQCTLIRSEAFEKCNPPNLDLQRLIAI